MSIHSYARTGLSIPEGSENNDVPLHLDIIGLWIETYGPMDVQGNFADRPASPVRGMLYTVIDSSDWRDGMTFRHNGTSWVVVGTKLGSTTLKPDSSSATAFTMQALTSQSGNMLNITDATNAVLMRMSAVGDTGIGTAALTGTTPAGTSVTPGSALLSLLSRAANKPALIVKSRGDQTGHVVELHDSTGTPYLVVTPGRKIRSSTQITLDDDIDDDGPGMLSVRPRDTGGAAAIGVFLQPAVTGTAQPLLEHRDFANAITGGIDPSGQHRATAFRFQGGRTVGRGQVGYAETTSDFTPGIGAGIAFASALIFTVPNMVAGTKYRVRAACVTAVTGGSNPTEGNGLHYVVNYLLGSSANNSQLQDDTGVYRAGAMNFAVLGQSVVLEGPFEVPANGTYTFGMGCGKDAGALFPAMRVGKAGKIYVEIIDEGRP